MRKSISAFLVLLAGTVGAAAEERSGPICSVVPKDCACVMPLPAKGQPVANLTEVQGEVLVSGAQGMTPPNGSVLLSVGDSVAVLAGGSARLSAAPHCNTPIPQMSSLVIRQVDGCACASLVSTQPAAPVLAHSGFSGGPAAALIGGTATAGGLIYLLTKEEEDNSVSP